MACFAFVQDASGKKTELQDGINLIGRESNFLRATLGKAFTEDLRISRKHVELIFTKQTGSLVIRVLGSNPAKYFPKTGQKAEIVLKGTSRPVYDGDSVQLLDGCYTLRLFIIKGNENRETFALTDAEPLQFDGLETFVALNNELDEKERDVPPMERKNTQVF